MNDVFITSNKLQKDVLAKIAKENKVTANLESIHNWVFSIGVGNADTGFFPD